MPYRVDARLTGRHPFELFTLYMAALVGLPTVLGLSPRPGSIDAELPPVVAFGWSLVLTLTALGALLGIYLPNRVWGLLIEQFSLVGVGAAALVYVVCALVSVGGSAGYPAALIAGFGLACLRRATQLQSVINEVHRVQQTNERLREDDERRSP